MEKRRGSTKLVKVYSAQVLSFGAGARFGDFSRRPNIENKVPMKVFFDVRPARKIRGSERSSRKTTHM